MDQMRNLAVSAYVDGVHRMCRITAELPDSGKGEAGLRRIRFVLSEQELGLFASRQAAISDIVHQLRIFGDDCLFFDLDYPVSKQGVIAAPYYRALIPWFVRQILVRIIKWIWSRGPQDGTETCVELGEACLRRWARRYGVGSGRVNVATDEVTRDYLSRRLFEPGTDLHVQIAHLKRVALNTTYAHFQTGTLELSKDWDGFFFRILNSRGRATLHGGIVDHGEPGRPSWSTHT